MSWGPTDKNQTIWVSRPFHLEKPDPILGSALVIDLPPSKKGTEYIKIDYETTGSLDRAAMFNGKTNLAPQPLSTRVGARRRTHLDTASGHASGTCTFQGEDLHRGPAACRHERGE